MQSVKGARHGISRMVSTIIVACMLAVLLVSSETTNGTEDVLQSRPYEHSHPECVTREAVEDTIKAMVGPVIESLARETSAAIDKLRTESATREDVEDTIKAVVGPVIESLVQETSAAINDLKIEIDKLQEK